MKLIKYLLIVLFFGITMGEMVHAQKHFTAVGDFSSAMNINFLEAKLNTIDLEVGDEIAVFDGTLCVGSKILTESLGELIDFAVLDCPVGADDVSTPKKDGFAEGNTILFKIWDASEQTEINVVSSTFIDASDGSVINPAPKFEKTGLTFVSITSNFTFFNLQVATEKSKCYGDTGRINLSVFSGGTPFNGGLYDIWLNGTLEGRMSAFSKALPAGVFSLVIGDANGSKNFQSPEVLQPAPISFNVSQTIANCSFDSGRVWIDVNSLSGGTKPYDYWLIASDPEFNSVVETMDEVTDTSAYLLPGNYYVRLFDTNGCFGDFVSPEGKKEVTVGTFDISYIPGECFGQPVDVEIILNFDNSNHQVSYTSDNGKSWQTSRTFQNLASGKTYWFGYRDETIGCTYFTEKKLEAPDSIVVKNIFRYDVTCFGLSDGKIVLPHISGGNGPLWNIHITGLNYKGEAVDLLFQGINDTTAVLTGLPASSGEYSVLVSDLQGCSSAVYKIAIGQPAPINFEVKAYNSTGSSCSEGRITVQSISGGQHFDNGKYQIWLNGSLQGTFSNYDSGNTLYPGDYLVTVTDSVGCSGTAVVTVASDISPISLVCPPDTTISSCLSDNQTQGILSGWIERTSATLQGGCNPEVKVTIDDETSICGGKALVKWVMYDEGFARDSCSAYFIVSTPEPVVVTTPDDNTLFSCDFTSASEVNQAFNNWVSDMETNMQQSVTGGCNPFVFNISSTSNNIDFCNDWSTMAKWAVVDQCDTFIVEAAFNLLAPEELSVELPADTTVFSCNYQNQTEIQHEFENWISSVNAKFENSLAGGCNPIVTNNAGGINVPALCSKWQVPVTWLITDKCDTLTVTANFGNNIPVAISYGMPKDTSVFSCDFQSVDEVKQTFESWLQTVKNNLNKSLTGGCNPEIIVLSKPLSNITLCSGWSATGEWAVVDKCDTSLISAEFLFEDAKIIAFEIPRDTTVLSCSFANKTEIQAVFEKWVSSQTARIKSSLTGGCSPEITNNAAAVVIPDVCVNWSTSVSWEVADRCEPVTVFATFNLSAPGGECPKHYYTVWEGTAGQNHMNINIIGAKLDGVDLQAGDEIGIFDGDICVGYGKVTKTIDHQNILQLVVSADDGTGNGYKQGNSVLYKIWDCSQSAEFVVQIASCFTTLLAPAECSPFEPGATTFTALEAFSVPMHFETCWTGNGNDHMIINVFSAEWDALPLEFGDEVAVFDGEVCVGVGKLVTTIDNNHILSISVSANDGSGCGFTDGNKIVFKFWDASAGLELKPISAIYFDNQLNQLPAQLFEQGATTFVQLSGVTEVCFTLELELGWNLFSIPTNQKNPDLKAIFQPLIDSKSLIKIQDDMGKSLENWGIFGGWKNNIGNVLLTEGYKINMSKYDTLRICGTIPDYPYPISLPLGWSIIGFPNMTAADGMKVIQTLINKKTLIKVQDEAGKSIENWGIFGGWKNNIGNFVPGKGYKIKMAAADTLWINEGYPKSSNITPFQLATTHFAPEFEGNGFDHMNINIVQLPVDALQAGDELAVFDGETCAGATTIMPHHLQNQSVAIVASAADNQGMPGFIEGEKFILKLWNATNDKEYQLEPVIIEGSPFFAKHETTVASLEKYLATGFDEIAEFGETTVSCYPNPFSESVTIEINLQSESEVEVEVLNQLGQRVKILQTAKLLNSGTHRLIWNGRNANNGEVTPGIYHLQIAVDAEITYHKIVLSK